MCIEINAWKNWKRSIQKRQKNWIALNEQLLSLSDLLILPEPNSNSVPSWFGYMISVRPESGLNRNAITRYLEDHNIQTRLLFSGNLVKHPCFNEIRGTDAYRTVGELPVTDFIMNNSFWVGVYPGMSDKMIEYMASVIKEAVKEG